MSTEEVTLTPQLATEELWRVAETDCVEQVDQLLAIGAEINTGNVHGVTALMRAAASGRQRMVLTLLQNGADPNMTRNDGFTPLLLASFFGHEEVVRLLVDHGADTNAESRFGTSAKMWATSRNFYEVADYLQHPDRTDDAPEIDAGVEKVVVADDVILTEATSEVIFSLKDTKVAAETRVVEKVSPRLKPVETWHGFEFQIEELRNLLPTLSFAGVGQFLLHRVNWVFAVGALAVLFAVLVVITDSMIRSDDAPRPGTFQQPEPVSQSSGTLMVTESTLSNSPTVSRSKEPKNENLSIPIGENNSLKKQGEEKQVATVRPVSHEPSIKQVEVEPDTVPTPSTEPVPAAETPAKTETAVKSKPPPEPSQDPKPAKPSGTATNQLLTGTKAAAPPGKVIRWP